MAAQPLSKKLAQEAVDALARNGGNVSRAADSLNLPRATLQTRLNTATRTGVRPRVATKVKAAPAVAAVPLAERQRRALQDRIDLLSRELRTAHRAENQFETLRLAVVRAAGLPFNPQRWKPVATPTGAPGTPVLFFSDAHFGQTVSFAESGGINEYNSTIARDRYRRMIDKTIELAFDHEPHPKYPNGIIYVRGGDLISGDIHEELVKTNDLQSLPSVKHLTETEIPGIERLAEKFGRVRIITLPGNHGRSTKKPESANFVMTNYDVLSGWMLEAYFSGHARFRGRVTFETPESGDALVTVEGVSVCFTHGDRPFVGGGNSNVGAIATAIIGDKRRRDMYARLGRRIDYTFIGHYHMSREVGSLVINGCVPGFDNYAKMLGLAPEPASQTLAFIHPSYGLSKRWAIRLSQLGKPS